MIITINILLVAAVSGKATDTNVKLLRLSIVTNPEVLPMTNPVHVSSNGFIKACLQVGSAAIAITKTQNNTANEGEFVNRHNTTPISANAWQIKSNGVYFLTPFFSAAITIAALPIVVIPLKIAV